MVHRILRLRDNPRILRLWDNLRILRLRGNPRILRLRDNLRDALTWTCGDGWTRVPPISAS